MKVYDGTKIIIPRNEELLLLVFRRNYYYVRATWSGSTEEKFIITRKEELLHYKREDVVYSKYILVLLILFLSNILMYILFGINILNSTRVMVLQDVIISSTTILFSFSIILPIIFRYRYKVGRIIAPFITIFIGYLSLKSNAVINNFIENGKETYLISVSRKIGALTYNIFKFNNYDYSVVASTIYIILLFIIAVILFLISNYIALKIYENRDLG